MKPVLSKFPGKAEGPAKAPFSYAKRAVASVAAVLLCLTPVVSQATTSIGSLAVSASISQVCAFGISSLAFGSYDPIGTNATTPLTQTGNISLACTPGIVLALTGDTGLHAASATGACATATCTRALNSTTNYLSYEIYTDSGHSTVWNATNSIPLTTTGVSQSVTIYGYIPAGNVQPAGSYSDTVTITATY